MITTDKIEQLAKQLIDSLPESIHKVSQDLQTGFRDILQNSLAKLDLVTREEFDVQTSVLLKTRQELTKLEEKIQLLETQINSKSKK